MTVRRYDSPLRYFVGSASRPNTEHLVELDAFHGNGACQCENFDFNMRPILERRRHDHRNPPIRCKHIKAAREFLADDIIRRLTQAHTPDHHQT